MKINKLLKKVSVAFLTLMMVVSTIATNVNPVFAEDANTGAIGAISSGPTKSTISGKDVKNVVDLQLQTGKLRLTFLTDNIFRLNFERASNDFLENAKPAMAEQQQYNKVFILDQHDSDYGGVEPTITESDTTYTFKTNAIVLTINKDSSLMKLTDKDGNVKWEEAKPIEITGTGTDAKATQTLKTTEDENFFGGGTQNGYFSHKNTKLQIRTGGGWEDGGRSNPVPFYMSTKGYGVLRHTFAPGDYDFSSTATFTHEEERFDAYYYVEAPTDLKALLDDFTKMTGRPVFWPRWGQYIGHADCYNYNKNTGERDLNNQGTTVLNNYVTNHEIPLGWMLPQDGYGCHYGKTGTVDGNVENLKTFTESANDLGVEVGLWTQSNLYDESANILRNVDKEVLTAGTRGIKTDVAWVGAGYAMQMNSVKTGYDAIAKSGDRPFIFSLYGWAGSQRYSGIWTGDQSGGRWEYIRFQIPSYIGSGLSGQPNVGSDIDSIYKGNRIIATRDLQWKAFSPMLYNMGGWDGSKADELDGKTPWEYSKTDGGESEAIQRFYLKTRSELTPYNYTLAKEANETGTPLARAMALEFADDPYTYSKATQYQYMWGKNLLIAPVYEGPANNQDAGKRDGIYLPDEDQTWIDYLSGKQYQGGQTLYNFEAPLWKLPIFVKSGAILPMTEDNNASGEITDAFDRIFDIYPDGNTDFTMYEDDGKSINTGSATTLITSSAPKMTNGEAADGTATITLDKRQIKGDYASQNKATELKISTQKEPTKVTLKFNSTEQTLTKVTKAEYQTAVANGDDTKNIYYFDNQVNLNKYAQSDKINGGEIITGPKLMIRTVKADVNDTKMEVVVEGFNNSAKTPLSGDVAGVPVLKAVDPIADTTPTSITVSWDNVAEATSYDALIDGKYILSNVSNPFTYKNLPNKTEYSFKVRSVNAAGPSAWSNELKASTKDNPFIRVPEKMTAYVEGGSDNYTGKVTDICDRDLTTEWHSSPGGGMLNKKVVIDMTHTYEIESVMYIPRQELTSNGVLKNIDLEVSKDGKVWKKVKDNYAVNVNQKQALVDLNGDLIALDTPQYARYIRITVNDSVGGFFDAKEVMPMFKQGTVPATAGASNVRLHTEALSEQDLVPFRNYNGFENPDKNYVEQVSRADMNYDGIIDGYDLAYVASKLNGGMKPSKEDVILGKMSLTKSKETIKTGEQFEMLITGNAFTDINAFSMKIPFDTTKYKLVSVLPTATTRNMLNYSTTRVHDDGSTDLYIAFANIGEAERISGSKSLVKVTVEALQDVTVDLAAETASIVNSNFSTIDALSDDTVADDWFPEVPSGEVNVPAEDITVTSTTADKWQSAGEIAKTADGKLDTYADSKWNYGAAAPFNLTYTFKDAKELDFLVFNDRANNFGVGTKKFTVTVTLEDDSTVEVGEFTKDVSAKEPTKKVELPKTKIKSIVINITECHNTEASTGNANLGVAEIVFTKNQKVVAEGIKFTKDAYTTVSSKVVNVYAKVTPDDVTNPHYSVVSKDENVAKVVKVSDNKGGYVYQVIAIAPGSTQLEATSIDNPDIKTTVPFVVKAGVDTSILEEQIARAEKLMTGIYTEETWTLVQEKLAEAKKVLDKSDATEEEVENTAIALQDAINGLSEIPVDPDTMIASEKITAEALYSESNKPDRLLDNDPSTFWESPYAGSNVGLPKDIIFTLSKEFTLQKLTFTAHNSINGAVTGYEVYTSIDGKNYSLANTGTVDPSVYGRQRANVSIDVRFTPVKAKYVKFVVTSALGRIPEEDNKYARIGDVALFGTEVQDVVDKAALKDIIDAVNALDKTILSAEEIAKIDAAVAKGLSVYNNPNATQEEVDGAIKDISDVLVDVLKSRLDELAKIENPGYTAESWKNYQDAIQKLKDVLDNPSATQQEIEEAMNEFLAAIDNLQVANPDNPNDPTTPGNPGDNGNGGNNGGTMTPDGTTNTPNGSTGTPNGSTSTPNGNTNTGDQTNTSMWLTLFVVSSAIAIFAGIRKYKKEAE